MKKFIFLIALSSFIFVGSANVASACPGMGKDSVKCAKCAETKAGKKPCTKCKEGKHICKKCAEAKAKKKPCAKCTESERKFQQQKRQKIFFNE